LLEAFFALEQGFVLTGGGALAGFHLRHRESQDLDLFARGAVDLDIATRTLHAAAAAIGASAAAQVTYPEFRRLLVSRSDEATLVDLVVDRAPAVDAPVAVGRIKLDSMREIAANKLCALLGRAEIRDLVDLKCLLDTGIGLEAALVDAARKDGGADPATLAWLLDQLTIAADARIPGGVSASELERFRVDLVRRLRRLAFPG
jgi:hypothetical protein